MIERPSALALVVAALVVFGGLGLIRLQQGGGPSDVASMAAVEAGSARSATVVDVSAGDRVVLVAPGDTLWSIAAEAAPGRDPRPLVVALAEVNGGTSLQIGQRIVIPRHLLG